MPALTARKSRGHPKISGCRIKLGRAHAFPLAGSASQLSAACCILQHHREVCVRGRNTAQVAWLPFLCLSQTPRFSFYQQLGHFLYWAGRRSAVLGESHWTISDFLAGLKKDFFWGICGWTVTAVLSCDLFWMISTREKYKPVSQCLIFRNVFFFLSGNTEEVSTETIVSPCKCQVSALGRWRAKLAPIISGWCTDLAKVAENEHMMERSWGDLVKCSAVWDDL